MANCQYWQILTQSFLESTVSGSANLEISKKHLKEFPWASMEQIVLSLMHKTSDWPMYRKTQALDEWAGETSIWFKITFHLLLSKYSQVGHHSHVALNYMQGSFSHQ